MKQKLSLPDWLLFQEKIVTRALEHLEHANFG